MSNIKFVSEWMSGSQLINSGLVKPGDLIEVKRSFYSHWALAVAKNEVIHFSGEPTDKSNAEIKKGSLVDMAGTSKVRINNARDKDYEVSSESTILERANSFVGKRSLGTMHSTYNFMENNCEHFATYCRYGEYDMGQSNMLYNVLFSPDGRPIKPRINPASPEEIEEINRENYDNLVAETPFGGAAESLGKWIRSWFTDEPHWTDRR